MATGLDPARAWPPTRPRAFARMHAWIYGLRNRHSSLLSAIAVSVAIALGTISSTRADTRPTLAGFPSLRARSRPSVLRHARGRPFALRDCVLFSIHADGLPPRRSRLPHAHTRPYPRRDVHSIERLFSELSSAFPATVARSRVQKAQSRKQQAERQKPARPHVRPLLRRALRIPSPVLPSELLSPNLQQRRRGHCASSEPASSTGSRRAQKMPPGHTCPPVDAYVNTNLDSGGLLSPASLRTNLPLTAARRRVGSEGRAVRRYLRRWDLARTAAATALTIAFAASLCASRTCTYVDQWRGRSSSINRAPTGEAQSQIVIGLGAYTGKGRLDACGLQPTYIPVCARQTPRDPAAFPSTNRP